MFWTIVIEWIIAGALTILLTFLTYYKRSKRKFELSWASVVMVVSYVVLWPFAWIEEITDSRTSGKKPLFNPLILTGIVFFMIASVITIKAVENYKQLDAAEHASSIYGRYSNN